MKHALFETPDGKREIRAADGSRAKPGDTDRRILHVLPKFFRPEEVWSPIKRSDIRLVVTSDALGQRGIDVLPAGGVTIGQPVPNRRYFVGGSADIRYGWIIPVPEDLAEIDLTMEWHFKPCTLREEAVVIRHRLNMTLLEGEGHTYSMDMSCWHRVLRHDLPPSERQPYTPGDLDQLSGYRQTLTQGSDAYAAGHDTTTLDLTEQVSLPALRVSDLWSIDEFSDLQLHEIDQGTQFLRGNDVHVANACIEVPAAPFVRAVELSRHIGFGQDTDFGRAGVGVRGHCETHPAIKTLCDWWNENAPDLATRCASFFALWVRVRDDNQYWPGCTEPPNISLDTLSHCPTAQGRAGNLVLFEFFKGAEHFTYDIAGVNIHDVTGAPRNSVGVSEEEIQSGEFDEAWYCLDALASFPARFPHAWRDLCHEAQLTR